MKAQAGAVHIAVWNLIINSLLAAAKLITGWMLHSTAMLSDGAHSIADALSGVAVIVGIRLSSRRTDARHPYGHERMECVAAVILAVLIGTTGIGIGWSAVQVIITAQWAASTQSSPAWIVSLVAIGVKETMFRYTRSAARKTGSAALMADAWHQRTDALSSLGGLLGVVGANMGFPILDPLAGVAIALLIMKAAIEIFYDAMRKMTDRSCDEDMQRRLADCVENTPGVCGVVELKTRLFGNRVLMEVTVQIKAGLSAGEAYAIAMAVREKVELSFEEIKTCAVHIHPSEIAVAHCKSGNDVV